MDRTDDRKHRWAPADKIACAILRDLPNERRAILIMHAICQERLEAEVLEGSASARVSIDRLPDCLFTIAEEGRRLKVWVLSTERQADKGFAEWLKSTESTLMKLLIPASKTDVGALRTPAIGPPTQDVAVAVVPQDDGSHAYILYSHIGRQAAAKALFGEVLLLLQQQDADRTLGGKRQRG